MAKPVRYVNNHSSSEIISLASFAETSEERNNFVFRWRHGIPASEIISFAADTADKTGYTYQYVSVSIN